MPRLLRLIALFVYAVGAPHAAPGFAPVQAVGLDALLAKFWSAKSPADAAKAADAVVKAGAPFDEVYARLKKGRPYSREVPTGIVRGRRAALGGEFVYTLDIPAAYDPGRAYSVRVQLHGGVTRDEGSVRNQNGIGRLAGAEQIYI